MTFGIMTLGCRVNQYESRVVAELLSNKGYREQAFSAVCDIYIINSCAVTAESVRKSRQMIRRARKYNPNACIIVAGCFSQISPEEARLDGIADHIIGNKNKIQEIVDSVSLNKPYIQTDSLLDAEYENKYLLSPTRSREYIKIQDGCDGRCAYCVIPRARGPIRSKPKETVINEVTQLAKKGVKEIILTGIEIASYQYSLVELIDEINAIPEIKRISMGSLEPTLISREFAERISKAEKLTPHFHISVQSGCTTVLNRMRRKYNISMLEDSINILKEAFPQLRLTCDIIVGFPGETDKEFQETYSFLKKNRFLHAHIFPYSKRPETEAANMPNQISEEVKIQRCSKLFKLQEKIKRELLALELDRKSVPVLFETYRDGVNCGHSDNFIEYRLESNEDLTGHMVNVVPCSVQNDYISAK